MANGTLNKQVGDGSGAVVTMTWTLTTADPNGAGIEVPEYDSITWLATGTWGGATLKVQGSADNTTFVATGLNAKAGGAEASASADKVFETIERPRFVRPVLTTVGAGASVTVVATMRRSSTMRT